MKISYTTPSGREHNLRGSYATYNDAYEIAEFLLVCCPSTTAWVTIWTENWTVIAELSIDNVR